MLSFIDDQMKANDELTANKLRLSIKNKFNIDISVSKVKRLRKGLGWRGTGTKYFKLV